jgi:multidrug efflux pump subunit AcrB
MNQLVLKAVKNSKIILFFTCVIALVGLYAYYLLPKQESPDVSAPVAMVITAYPGAPASDVKDLVTKKIEDKLAELTGSDKCNGISKEGVSIVLVEFEFTNDIDPDKAFQDVRNAVADVQTDLPSGCLQSQVNTKLTETAGMVISLSGKNYTYEQLASFGEQFKDKLADINGVSKFEITGELDKEVKVDVNTAKLNQLGLSIDDVCSVLKAQNIEIPSGTIDYQDGKITVSTPGIYKSVDDISNTILIGSPQTGIVTRLGDIADVHMGIEEGVEKYKQNAENAVLLTGYFKAGENVVIIGKDVRRAIDEVKAQLPGDLTVQEIVCQPDDVSKSTNEFMLHLIIGILLVILVVFWGMGLRNALVVSAAIPISILMTFGVMFLLKIPIHQISLTALIVSLGILVDNAIVVCDTIQTSLNNGESKIDAAYLGTRRCVIPVFTATLIIVAAFSPLMGMPGPGGKFLLSIPLVLITSILASYVVAMFITPTMTALVGRPEKFHKKKESRLRSFFGKLLDLGLNYKNATVLGAFAVLVLTVGLVMPRLPVEFFPFADKDLFYINISSEKAGNIDAAEELADDVSALLKKEPEITSVTEAIGNGMPRYYVTMPISFPSNDFAQVVCKFDLKAGNKQRFKDNAELANYIQKLLDQNIAGGNCKVNLLALARPADAKVILKVSGNNLEQINEVANSLKREIKKIPGTTNVRDDMPGKTYQLEVKMDEDKASSLGISKYDVQKQINIALYGNAASVYRRNGEEYVIRVKSDIKDVALLQNLKIKSSVTGNKIPLNEFATVGVSSKTDTIKTYQRKQTISVLVDLLPGYNATNMENTIEAKALPEVNTAGAKIKFEGEREEVGEHFGAVGILFMVALFMIYLILFVQFNSFLKPLVILLTIPLSLIGSLTGLFLLNVPLSMTAFLGIISLVGLVVKNGILLIDYIEDARKVGLSIDEACKDGVAKRYNAIILSALTVILALIPLAVSRNPLFSPMAVTLMFGLAVSTFLTMVVVPVVYGMIENASAKRKKDKPLVITG